MKKLLTIAVASIAFAVLADGGSQQIGVTTFSTSKKNTIIPVPFTSLRNGSAVSPADLVKTTGLDVDTYLIAYLNGSYQGWELVESDGVKSWQPAIVSGTSTFGVSVSSGEATLPAGSAIWIVLPQAKETTITVYGAYVAQSTSTAFANASTIVANPVQARATFTVTAAANGDMITIPNDDGAPDTYRYVAAKEKWFKIAMGAAPTEGLPTMDVGQGFWYTSKGSSNATISWSAAE